MGDCKTLYWGVIEDYYGTDWHDLCCYTQPPQTYNDFVTGISSTYDNYCLKDRVFADYVTQLYNNCLSGVSSGMTGVYVTGGTANGTDDTLIFTNSSGGTFTVANSALLFNDAYVSGGTLNTTTGCVTFNNTSGGTFEVCGFTGFTSYWSANTDGSISTSGNTTHVHIPSDLGVTGNTTVGGDLNTHDIFIDEGDKIYFDGTDASPNTYIHKSGQGLDFTVLASQKIYITNQTTLFTNNHVTIDGGDLNVSGDTNINGVISGNTNARFSGVLGVSGNTFLGDVDAATPTATDNILIVQSGGLVESITTAELTGLTEQLWSANTDGSISPSGLTTNIGIGTSTPNEELTVVGAISATSRITTNDGFTSGSNKYWRVGLNSLLFANDSISRWSMDMGMYDSYKQYYGNGNDMAIYHNGSNGILDNNTGTLSILSATLTLGDITSTVTVNDNLEVNDDLNVSGNSALVGVLGVSGRTYLGTVDAATPTAADKILIVQGTTGEIESITTTQLTGFTSDYWVGDGTGTGIKPSGTTTNVTLGGNLGVTGGTYSNTVSAYTQHIASTLGVSGRTYLGTVDAATPTAVDNILIVRPTGVIKSITTAELTGFTSDYWIGDGTGTGIKPSGVTTNVTVDGNIHGNSNLRIDQLVHFNTASTSANTYIGYKAGNPGINDTLHQFNTAIGHQALANQTGGGDVDENVAVGYRSLYSVSSGEWNTGLGTNTARFITTTDGNTAIGNKALGGTPAVGGAYNIAIGYMSAYNVKGSGNMFCGIGTGAGNNSGTATGSNNVGIGDYAVGGGAVAGTGTLTTGDYNLGLGSKSLQNLTSGDNNIAIGGLAGDNITSGDYNILIGASQDPPSATADYQMNIGGIIHGKDLTSSSSINAVGIGIVSPTAKLHVDGTTILTGELGVSGDTNINGVISGNTNARFSGNLGVSGRTYLGNVDAATATASDKILIVQSDGEIESITTTQLTGLTDGLFWTANTDGSISNSGLTGHVGVGTDTPNKPLTVVGDISGTTALYLGNATNFISGETVATGDLSIHSGDDIELYSGDDIVLNATEKIKFTQLNAAQPSLQIDLNDNAGTAFLQNAGDNTVIAIDDANQRLYFYDIGGEYIVSDGTDLTIASGTDILLDPTGYAGIGISAPTTKLHIVETSEGDDPLRVQTVNTGDGYMLLIQDDGVVKKSEKVIVTSTGDVGISGNTNINGLLSADTNVIVHGVLGVSGTTNVHGELSAATNVHVTGEVGISGRTNVHGILSAGTGVHVTGEVGIGTATPATALDVHHDPTGLATNTGGGEVVTFGSGTLVKGKLYYMNTSGAWIATNANAVGTGGSQLLGIALGTSASAGVLLRGFFDMASYLGPGSFNQGVPLYVSGTAGQIAITQPSGSTDFARVVGYCTDTANVIYFNPDGTYITIA